MYTVKQIQESRDRIWVRCHSLEQARKIGLYYRKKGIAWQNFDFKNKFPLIAYMSHKGEERGGWNPDGQNGGELVIEFDEINFRSSINYEIY